MAYFENLRHHHDHCKHIADYFILAIHIHYAAINQLENHRWVSFQKVTFRLHHRGPDTGCSLDCEMLRAITPDFFITYIQIKKFKITNYFEFFGL